MGQITRSPVATAEAIGRNDPFRAALSLAGHGMLGLRALHLPPHWVTAFGRIRTSLPALLRAVRFSLLSLVYGAAAYSFLVAYLLMLGAMFEPPS